MPKKIVAGISIIVAAIALLVFSAVQETAKAVVTVSELAGDKSVRSSIRLGARVADSKIQYKTEPEFKLEFIVMDIESGEGRVPVVYNGIMPDTLKVGRDVILEGDFDGEKFQANSLLTQCPSKYEPPSAN